jgi:predicted nicotinamide N-methyase
MPLSFADLDFLVTSAGARLLEHLNHEDLSENRILSILTRLRHEYSPEQARAALEMAQLRRKAGEKFGSDAAHMFFTREALEQASDPQVRHYRSQIMAGLRVVDACCGIGADSLAIARVGSEVLGLDIDPLRVRIAECNAKALGLKAQFQVSDVRDGLPESDLVFFDPARRDPTGKRIHDVERYQPPLSLLRQWRTPHIVVKLSPGVELEQLANYGGSIEFISVRGDLKEAVLWLGFELPRRKATLLTHQQAYHWESGEAPMIAPLSSPLGWLIEPDAALLRAGLVADVALALGVYQIDETIAYLTADEQPDSPWVRAWKILDWMPFHLKRLRAYLRAQNVGRVTVKKRGTAITPEELVAGLKLKGTESRTLVLTRWQGQPIVLICEDIQFA